MARRSASTSSSTSSSIRRVSTSMRISVALLDEPERAARGGLRGDVPDADARRPAGEAPVGDQRAHRTEARALEERGRVQHLLHARPARGALVAHDDDVAGPDLALEDDRDGLLLGVDDARRPLEVPPVLGQAGALDDGALGGQVAGEDGEAAVGGERVRDVVDAAGGRVGVERAPAVGRRERLGGPDAARGRVEQLDRLLGRPRARGCPSAPARPRASRRGPRGRRGAAARRGRARRGSRGCRRRGGRPPCGSSSSARPC